MKFRTDFILKTFKKILILLVLLLFCFQQSSFAQDTIAVTKSVNKKAINPVDKSDSIHVKKPAKRIKFSAEPLKASMMAVAFPGLGQIYNRKIWKIPLVYAGFGGLIYSVGLNSKNYIKYMKAYQDFKDAIPATKSYEALILADPKTYDPVQYPKSYVPANAAYYEDGMLRMVDYYKRYRDLSYIGIAGWYLLSILDANVDASLFNYDVSDNLDIAVFPSQVPLPGGFMGAGINVGLRVTF